VRNGRTARIVLVVSVLGFASGPAAAQVATTAESIADPFAIRRPASDLDALTRMYNTSEWVGLTRLAREVVCVARRTAAQQSASPGDSGQESCAAAGSTELPLTGGVADALDTRRTYVAVMWIGQDGFGTPQLLRFVVHDDNPPRFRPDLPGVSGDGEAQLVELFLSPSPHGAVVSVYVSRRDEDPLLEQLPQFVRALAGPLFTTVGAIAGAIPGLAKPELASVTPTLTATVRRVRLPYRRATIRLKATAREPMSTAEFTAAARRLESSVSFTDVPNATCARDLARQLAEELPPITRSPSCSGPEPSELDCRAALDAVLTRNFTSATSGCESGKPSRETLQALALVDKRFRALVQTGMATNADLDLTFKNRPLSRFAFGAGSAVMIEAWQDRARVDTNDGIIVAEPLPRVMTMAFVNWSPAGYDAEDEALSPAERWRLFAGAVLTPDFGPTFGLNVLLARGIGITAGGAVLFGRGADESEVGQPPRANDPFRLSVARTAFVGISYNYK
jgi:hypothetical protein